MPRIICFLAIILFLLAGCGQQGMIIVTVTDIPGNPPVPTPMFQTNTPAPDRARCFGFDPDGEFEIISDNYCLDGPFSAASDIGIVQDVPAGFEIVNVLENADGYADDYTDYALVDCDGDVVSGADGCAVQVYNGETGINGMWGYRQTVEDVGPGCYLCKISLHGWINDPPISHQENYGASCYINGALLSREIFHTQGDSQIIFPFQVTETADVTFGILIDVGWATPGETSYFDLLGVGLLAVPDGYCED